MKDLELVKEFLRSKKSYLKVGANRIQLVISKKKSITPIATETINRAKKEVKKELKNSLFKEDKIEVTPELLAKFNELAVKMGIKGIQAPVAKEDKLKSILQKRKKPHSFHVPEIKDQVGMHILLACSHVPFHHKQLHKGIINLIKDYPELVKGFHLMGDFLDLNPLSSHDKGRFTAVPGLTLNDEYRIGRELLDDFDRALPKDCWKTYIYGNHEDRHNRWMSVMDNAKTPLLSPEEGLKLWERGYNVKTSWSQDFITLGKDFDIFHGIYFSIHNGKAHLDKLRRSCAYGHTHRSQVYREGQMAAYNIGAGADFTAKAFNYATRPMKAQWSNGFAIDMIDCNGISNVTQIHVTPDGHFYFGGKRY